MIRGWKRGICVKDRTQTVGWIILFLIASGFFGCISAWLLKIESGIAFFTFSGILGSIALVLLLILYHKMQKRSYRQDLWAMLCRGCYHEVNHRISEKNKQMKYLWELKMLASFHSGDMATFDRLYKNYMNEINECKTLPAYMLCVLHELVDAMSHDKPPAVFLKNDTGKRAYVKQRDYQLYHYIQQGIQEYYGNQKHLMKIYFERFMMQTDVLSKPLGFHLHYLMTVFMLENDHPQWEEYYRKTQQYIFDEKSQSYMEDLKARIYGLQKGTGNQKLMNRDQSRKRNNPLFENESTQSLNRSFNYQQSSPQREDNQQFASRRQRADIQKEFDEMNSSLDNGNAFPLYEEDESDFLKQKNSGSAANDTSSIPIASDEGDDLDPTWFARKTMESAKAEVPPTRAFNRRNPSVSDSGATNSFGQQRTMNHQNPSNQNSLNQNTMNHNPMNQEPMNRSPYADDPTFANQRRGMNRNRSNEQPLYNQNNSSMYGQNPQPMNSQMGMNANQGNGYSPQNAYQQTQELNQPQFQTNNRDNSMGMNQSDQPYNDYDRNEDDDQFPTQNFAPTKSKKQKKLSRKERKRLKAENADYEASSFTKDRAIRGELSAQGKRSDNDDRWSGNAQPYHTYLRTNITIFFVTLVDAILVSLATASVVYTSFFNRFSSISSDIVPDIMIMAVIITLITAYLTASLHTGYTILSKSIRNWNKTVKIILSPILLVLCLIIGVICEIPYLIYANIKKRNE